MRVHTCVCFNSRTDGILSNTCMYCVTDVLAHGMVERGESDKTKEEF